MEPKKKFKMVLLVILLALLFFSVRNYTMKENIVEDARNGDYHPERSSPPEKIELHALVFSNVNNTAFYFKPFGFTEPVLGITEAPIYPLPLSKLHSICIWGFFDAEGTFHIINFRIFYYEFLKYIISLIGLIWFIRIFFEEWKITWRGFYARLA